MLLSVIRQEGYVAEINNDDALLEILRSQINLKVTLGLYNLMNFIMGAISSAHKEDVNFRKAASVFIV